MKLAIKEKVFSLKERFEILDENGTPVYQVAGKLLSWGHKLTVYDMEGQEAAHVDQKVLSLVPKYFITEEGHEEMELKGHITLLRPHYTLETSGGDWEVRGNFLGHEYEMKRGGHLVASVNKKWFSWGDTYLLDVKEDRDVLAALGVMLAIDCVEADTNHAQSATIASSIS